MTNMKELHSLNFRMTYYGNWCNALTMRSKVSVSLSKKVGDYYPELLWRAVNQLGYGMMEGIETSLGRIKEQHALSKISEISPKS